jgi:hypothetical protein
LGEDRLEAELGRKKPRNKGYLIKGNCGYVSWNIYPNQQKKIPTPLFRWAKQPVKLVPDAMTIASYNKFKNNGNTAMVQTLEEMYKFPENA